MISCTYKDCNREQKSKGYCKTHYNSLIYKKSPAGLAAQRRYQNKKYANNESFKVKTKIRAKNNYDQVKDDPKFKQQRSDYVKRHNQETGYSERHYQENKEAIKAKTRKWRKDNPDKARALDARKKWYREQATPKWLTKDQKKEIDRIYGECPEGYHVDHIIPLRGRNVSGLHVPENLQYLPATENMKKHNKFVSL